MLIVSSFICFSLLHASHHLPSSHISVPCLRCKLSTLTNSSGEKRRDEDGEKEREKRKEEETESGAQDTKGGDSSAGKWPRIRKRGRWRVRGMGEATV